MRKWLEIGIGDLYTDLSTLSTNFYRKKVQRAMFVIKTYVL